MENRKGRHMESWRPTPAEEKHGYFHALQMVFLGAPLDQHLARLLLYLSFCMASEVSTYPDLQDRICWHQLLPGIWNTMATSRN